MPEITTGNLILPYILPFILVEGGYNPEPGIDTAITIQSCRNVVISDIIIEEIMTTPGISIDASNVHIKDSWISNKGIAIYATNLSKVTSKNNIGINNIIVLKANNGSFIYKIGDQPFGDIQQETETGGYIF